MSLKFERFLYKKRPGVFSFRRSPKPPEPRPDIFKSFPAEETALDTTEAEQEKGCKRKLDDSFEDSLVTKRQRSEGAEEASDSAKARDNDIFTLRNMFPDIGIKDIEDALSKSGSLDEAAITLSTVEVKKGTQKKKSRIKRIAALEESEDSSSESEASVESDDDDENEGERGDVAILSFYDSATIEELVLVPTCSAKKASKIVELRPFKNWHDMCHKFHEAKLHYHKLLEGAKELMKERNMLDRLIGECEKMSFKINSALEDLGLQAAVVQSNRKLFQPSLINSSMQLKGYQLIGLNWLITLHIQGMNGILADQMGLGKTAQAIAFLAYLIESDVDGPHAIIVPSSTADNWIREIEMWIPSVTYAYYTGMQTERSALRADILGRKTKPDIIVSSYATAISTPEDRKFFRKLNCHYLVLDEGHMVKNVKSLRYQHLQSLKARRKLLLTGTPLQNNLVELISLLNFVMPNIFEQRFDGMRLLLTSDKKGAALSTYESEKIEHVKKVIEPFILRRLKEDVLQDLPKKIERVIHCDITENQDILYQRIMSDLKKNVGGDKLVMNSLMELRKAACHPLLCRQHYNDSLLAEITKDFCSVPENSESTHEYVFEDLTVMSDFEIHHLCQENPYLSKYRLDTDLILNSGKFRFLSEKLKELQHQGDRCLIFSQFTMMMDIMEPFLSHFGYRYLRLDGQTPVSERQALIDTFNQDPDILVFLLSTKAGGMGINLTSANTVIIHDLDYNPYNDKQAEDRCHRVGQTRDVTIYKLVCKGTIEEGIYQCAENKLSLERNIAGVDETDIKENVLKWIQQTLK